MTRDDRLTEAGRTIRSELPELVPDGWEQLDDELAEALARPDAESAACAARVVLGSRSETAQWLATFLGPERDISRGAPANGSGYLVQAPRFACPNGDYVWYRRTSSRPIPLCRTHGLRLVVAPRLSQ